MTLWFLIPLYLTCLILPVHLSGSFNIKRDAEQPPALAPTEVAPDPNSVLDIDPSLILLDPQAEKLLSSIDMESLAAIGVPRTSPEETAPPPAPTPSPGPPPAASTPYIAPRTRPLQGPRFRPRGGPGGPFIRRPGPPGYPRFAPFPPRMDRGGFRPRW